MLCKTLGQQFATSDATDDDDAGGGSRDGLTQGRQRQQGFAVIALFREGHLQTCSLQYACSRLTYCEPTFFRGLHAGLGDVRQQHPGSGFADHDERLIAVQAGQQLALALIQSNGLDRQQGQATAGHTRRREALRQCRAVLVGPGQQQAPGTHGCPASP
ncbi:hypothetical protein D3C71_1628030 [compost metagenome]